MGNDLGLVTKKVFVDQRQGPIYILLGAFAGAHWTAVPAAVEIGFTAARIPLAFHLVRQGWGVEGVWFAIASTTVIKGTLLAVLFAARQRRTVHASERMPYNDRESEGGTT